MAVGTHPRQGKAGHPYRSDEGATLGGPTKRERGRIVALERNYSTMVPSATEFERKDFLYVASLQEMGDGLIAQWPELNFIASYEVRFLWKASGGRSGGAPKLGKCVLTSGLVEFFGGIDWVVWLSADWCREMEFGDEQIEALVYHELLHCTTKGEDEEEPALRGHDFEGFAKEIERYGFWDDTMRVARGAVQGRLALDVSP